jgi:hypothetical protein
VRAFDTAGNFDATPASRRFTVVFPVSPPPPAPEEPPKEPRDPDDVLGGRDSRDRPATAAAPGEALPFTGANVTSWLLTGILLILLGAAPLLPRRSDPAEETPEP